MAFTNKIEYVTIGSTGNGTDFGDLSATKGNAAGVSSETRGVFAGGRSPSVTNAIEYVTIASTGNVTDFGDLTTGRAYLAGMSNSTTGVYAGGGTPSASNVMDFIILTTDYDMGTFASPQAVSIEGGTL